MRVQSWLEAKVELECAFMHLRMKQLENMVKSKFPEPLIQLQVEQIVMACHGQKGEA